jgi:hypothetical protein
MAMFINGAVKESNIIYALLLEKFDVEGVCIPIGIFVEKRSMIPMMIKNFINMFLDYGVKYRIDMCNKLQAIKFFYGSEEHPFMIIHFFGIDNDFESLQSKTCGYRFLYTFVPTYTSSRELSYIRHLTRAISKDGSWLEEKMYLYDAGR